MLLRPDNMAHKNQYGGDNLNNLEIASETEMSNNTQNLFRAKDLQDVKGMSSYGDLLNDVVEDEFELTIDESQAVAQNLQRILFKPTELANKYNIASILYECVQPVNSNDQMVLNTNPLLKRNVAKATNFCP